MHIDWPYLLDHAAWAAGGYVLCLIVERLTGDRASQGRRMSFEKFIGVITILIALVGVALSAAYRIEQGRYEKCQSGINDQLRNYAAEDRHTVDLVIFRVAHAHSEQQVTAALAAYERTRHATDQARAAVTDETCPPPSSGP